MKWNYDSTKAILKSESKTFNFDLLNLNQFWRFFLDRTPWFSPITLLQWSDFGQNLLVKFQDVWKKVEGDFMFAESTY